MFQLDFKAKQATDLAKDTFLTICPFDKSWATEGAVPMEKYITWFMGLYGCPGMNAVDIGAHCGTWTVAMAKCFKHVTAFEPNKEVFWNLCANLLLKGLRNVDAHQLVVSNRSDGKADYFVRTTDGSINGVESLGDIDATSPPEVRQVSRCTLDSMGLEDVRFIRISVQGHELEILKGATKTILRDMPFIVCSKTAESFHGIPVKQQRDALDHYIMTVLGYKVVSIIDQPNMFIAVPTGPATLGILKPSCE